jgi:hypothetical protein
MAEGLTVSLSSDQMRFVPGMETLNAVSRRIQGHRSLTHGSASQG